MKVVILAWKTEKQNHDSVSFHLWDHGDKTCVLVVFFLPRSLSGSSSFPVTFLLLAEENQTMFVLFRRVCFVHINFVKWFWRSDFSSKQADNLQNVCLASGWWRDKIQNLGLSRNNAKTGSFISEPERTWYQNDVLSGSEWTWALRKSPKWIKIRLNWSCHPLQMLVKTAIDFRWVFFTHSSQCKNVIVLFQLNTSHCRKKTLHDFEFQDFGLDSCFLCIFFKAEHKMLPGCLRMGCSNNVHKESSVMFPFCIQRRQQRQWRLKREMPQNSILFHKAPKGQILLWNRWYRLCVSS